MADGWPVKSPDATLKQLESELGSQIQALEAAALGRDPDALLAVARELEQLLGSRETAACCRTLAQRLRGVSGLRAACEVIEAVAGC